MKLNELIEPKPSKEELEQRERFDSSDFHGELPAGRKYVAKNQTDALIRSIMARLHEMDINTKHVSVHWSSPRQATVFPPASIRFVVKNRKSEIYDGTEQAALFPSIAKGLVKNAFRDVFGEVVNVEREDVVSEYSNGMRYLDFKVDVK